MFWLGVLITDMLVLICWFIYIGSAFQCCYSHLLSMLIHISFVQNYSAAMPICYICWLIYVLVQLLSAAMPICNLCWFIYVLLQLFSAAMPIFHLCWLLQLFSAAMPFAIYADLYTYLIQAFIFAMFISYIF